SPAASPALGDVMLEQRVRDLRYPAERGRAAIDRISVGEELPAERRAQSVCRDDDIARLLGSVVEAHDSASLVLADADAGMPEPDLGSEAAREGGVEVRPTDNATLPRPFAQLAPRPVVHASSAGRVPAFEHSFGSTQAGQGRKCVRTD